MMEMMKRLDDKGDALLEAENYTGAWRCYRKALILRQKVDTIGDGAVTKSLEKMTSFLETVVARQPEESATFFEEAILVWQQVVGRRHPDTATIWHNLGYVFKQRGQLKKALACYDEALTIWESQAVPDLPHTAACLNNMGTVLRRLGLGKMAEQYLKQALEIWCQVDDPVPDIIATACNNLALVYLDMGQYEAAQAYLEKARAIWEHIHGSRHQAIADVLNNLGAVHEAAGRQLFPGHLDGHLEEALGRKNTYPL